MKTLLAASLLALAAASLPAHAERGTGARWCLQQKGFGWNGSAPDCSYVSLAQCNETASGNVGYCMENPFYHGPQHRRRGARHD
jgi:hypothetical protein